MDSFALILGDYEGAANQQIYFALSHDLGRTWPFTSDGQNVRAIAGTGNLPAWAPTLFVPPTNARRLLMYVHQCSNSEHFPFSMRYYWVLMVSLLHVPWWFVFMCSMLTVICRFYQQSGSLGAVGGDVLVMESADLGNSWGSPRVILPYSYDGGIDKITMDQVVVNSETGEWMLVWNSLLRHQSGREDFNELNARAQPQPVTGVLVSTDEGATWTTHGRIIVPLNVTHFQEPTLALCVTNTDRTGSIGSTIDIHTSGRAVHNSSQEVRGIILFRSAVGHIYISRSSDAGVTWTAVEPTALPNPNSRVNLVSRPLPAGGTELLLAYNPSSHVRQPLVLARSRDCGVTWESVASLYPGEASYPTILALNESVWTIFTRDSTTRGIGLAMMSTVPTGREPPSSHVSKAPADISLSSVTDQRSANAFHVAGSSTPLLGNYGYVTRYNVTEDEARQAVRLMFLTYGVREVQFYDVAFSYSQPFPSANASEWITKASSCFTGTPRNVRRDTVMAYIDEIRKLGGRSWMYVQAVGADEPAAKLPGSTPYENSDGRQVTWLKNSPYPCFYVYQPTVAWARRQASIWGAAAADLGFDGIHWDQLGVQSDSAAQNAWMGANFSLYLNETRRVLQQQQLRQSFNFVDGFGWRSNLYLPAAPNISSVTFPYWECWSDAAENAFFGLAIPGSVFARYPDPGCCGNPPGFSADDLMVPRFNKSAAACGSYILVGDGERQVPPAQRLLLARAPSPPRFSPLTRVCHTSLPYRRLVRDYWPAAVPLTDAESTALKEIVTRPRPQC